MTADLHLHTNFSDGTFTPEELTTHAKRHDLRAIALTDHDTMEGCARTAAACKETGIQFIPATELTAEQDGIELHLLGYYLDSENETLKGQLTKFQEVRQNRIVEITERLRGLGVQLEAESVFRLANCRAPGRPHVARAMVKEGYVGSLDEAFERFLKKGKPAWAPKFKMSAAEAIELIHQAGGVAVLAHPGLSRADETIDALISSGLDGLECFHTKHSTYVTEHYLEIAERHGLVVTGGSDCHGMSKGKPLIGTLKIPYQYVEWLEQRRSARVKN